MAVLSSLGSGHLDDLAGMSLQHHVAVLAQGGALHGKGGGGARLAGCEVKIGICHGVLTLERCRRHSGFTRKRVEGKKTVTRRQSTCVHTQTRGSAN